MVRFSAKGPLLFVLTQITKHVLIVQVGEEISESRVHKHDKA